MRTTSTEKLHERPTSQSNNLVAAAGCRNYSSRSVANLSDVEKPSCLGQAWDFLQWILDVPGQQDRCLAARRRQRSALSSYRASLPTSQLSRHPAPSSNDSIAPSRSVGASCATQ